MKKTLYGFVLLCLSLLSVSSYGQKLTFSYDAAGNQITRTWVCVNCAGRSATASVAESAPLKVEVKVLDTAKKVTVKRTITASPNPFLENLNVNWETESGVAVKNITVFNISGMKMTEVNPLPNQYNVTIPFQRFATGMYILYITFSDNKRESIKVIKK